MSGCPSSLGHGKSKFMSDCVTNINWCQCNEEEMRWHATEQSRCQVTGHSYTHLLDPAVSASWELPIDPISCDMFPRRVLATAGASCIPGRRAQGWCQSLSVWSLVVAFVPHSETSCQQFINELTSVYIGGLFLLNSILCRDPNGSMFACLRILWWPIQRDENRSGFVNRPYYTRTFTMLRS